jgi:WD40 repeat protein
MRTKIIPDSEDSLDDLVVRARSDSELQRLIHMPRKTTIKIQDVFSADLNFDVIGSLCISPDNEYLAYIAQGEAHLRKINYLTSSLVHAGSQGMACSIDFYPSRVVDDGHVLFDSKRYMLAIGGESGLHLHFFDKDHLDEKTIFDSPVNLVAFNKKGDRLAVNIDRVLQVYEFDPEHMASGDCIFSTKAHDFVNDMAFGGDDRDDILYVAHKNLVYSYDMNYVSTKILEMKGRVSSLSIDFLQYLSVVSLLELNPNVIYRLNVFDLSKKGFPLTELRASCAAFGNGSFARFSDKKLILSRADYNETKNN